MGLLSSLANKDKRFFDCLIRYKVPLLILKVSDLEMQISGIPELLNLLLFHNLAHNSQESLVLRQAAERCILIRQRKRRGRV